MFTIEFFIKTFVKENKIILFDLGKQEMAVMDAQDQVVDRGIGLLKPS